MLTGNLAGHGMGTTDLVTPESSSDGNNGELGQDDGAANSGCYFLGALDAEADVAVRVADGDEGLEASALTGAGLLLDRHDLQHLVLKSGTQIKVDDLELLQKMKFSLFLF